MTPFKPAKACRFSGCGGVARGDGYCAEHQSHAKAKRKAQRKEYRRSNPSDPFYASAVWMKARRRHLSRCPLCWDCKRRGVTQRAEIVHHIVERSVDPSRSLDPTNLRAVCGPCHAAYRNRGAGVLQSLRIDSPKCERAGLELSSRIETWGVSQIAGIFILV